MQDERRVSHPMKDGILQMPRDAFAAQQGISDNETESREPAGAEIRQSAASSTSEANDLHCLMNALQVADCMSVSKMSAYKLVEQEKIPRHKDCEISEIM